MGWELPEDRPQLRAQPQHARRHEVRQRRLDVLQAAHMGDVARSLDREHEAGRGLVAPAGQAVGLQEAIEGAVDLYRREAPGGKAKLALSGPLYRVHHATPAALVQPRKPNPQTACLLLVTWTLKAVLW